MDHVKTTATEPVQSLTSPAKNRHPRRTGVFLAAIAALLALFNWGTKTRIVTRYYEITDARVHDEVRIAIVCDLHGAQYGKKQSDLIAALEEASPTVVLLLGDIYDQDGIESHAVELIDALSSRFTCYFVPGNHEYKSGELNMIRNLLRESNIPNIAGETVTVQVKDTQVQIFGIDDGQGGKAKQLWQIENAAKQRNSDIFSILAIHVPNGVESYLHYGFDLMLSGHTHGGQIILPHVLNGLYAPGQGFFPKYGGGRYDFGKQTLIISRGLSQKPLWLPRFGNPPELSIITLKPAS
jgi:predicted MPP superfamily phosphohydrolase